MKLYACRTKNMLSVVLIFTGLCFSHAQTFTSILTGPVVNTVGDSRSVNWIDVNNDGLVDLMITNGPAGGQDNMLYMNNGGGVFTAVTGSPVVADHSPSDGASWADTDNDGDMDAFVVNWYNISNMYYINTGGGFIQDSTQIIATDGGYSETASWGDFDNDGLVDLYVCNSAGNKKNFLYHNDGNNQFSKITTGTMVNDAYESRCVNWTDMDLDGDLDLFVTNESTQHENIYRNDAGTAFTRITTGDLVNDAGNTMSGSWGDYDNDGDLDVLLANDQGNNGLFRNDGNFTFTKILTDTVSNSNAHSFSSAWSDIDNDGDLDLFVTNSFGTTLKQLNFLYLNNNGTFSRVSNTAPATDSSWSYGCAFGDYDNDGFEDLAVATVRFNGVDQPDLLYHNDGNSNHWITIKLTGTLTNRSAIGTKIRIKAMINGNPVWQMREISAQTSYCGQNDLRAHFGLGNASVIDSIKVEWLSGTIENYTAANVNQFIHIIEGSGIQGMEVPASEKKHGLIIYPNPHSANITLALPTGKLMPGDVITVTDIKGRQLMKTKISEPASEMEIDFLQEGIHTAGTFFITVTSTGKIFTGKFVKP